MEELTLKTHGVEEDTGANVTVGIFGKEHSFTETSFWTRMRQEGEQSSEMIQNFNIF